MISFKIICSVWLAKPGKTGVLSLVVLIAGLSRVSMAAPSVTFWGSISNTFYLPNEITRNTRSFKVVVNGSDSSYDVTNGAHRYHAAFKNGELSSTSEGPATNHLGLLTNAVSARIERRQVPRDDACWINYLWLAFGCHSYFTSRSDLSALPIWPTSDRQTDEDDAKMGTLAFYTSLPGSKFPSEVNYVAEGFDYFRGNSGLWQRSPLLPPLNAGYTNFSGHTVTYTNIEGLLIPAHFEIHRYAPKRSGPDANAALRILTDTSINVDRIVAGVDEVAQPGFNGILVAQDFRASTPTSAVRYVWMPMTKGVWPTFEDVEKMHSVLADDFEQFKRGQKLHP